SAHGDLHALVLVLAGLQMTERAVELACGIVADRTGVDDDDVGVGAVIGTHITRTLERAGEALGVVHVHLAPEGAHLVGAPAPLGIDRGRGGRDDRGFGGEKRHAPAILRSVAEDGSVPAMESSSRQSGRSSPPSVRFDEAYAGTAARASAGRLAKRR